MPTLLRVVRVAAGVSLALSAALFVLWSWRWPLVGDASLIHYIAFLIERGKAPYRDIVDMNMPGTFLIEMAGMEVFGGGAVAWRMFDFTLLAVAAGSFAVMTRRAGWFPGVFAGALFALVHGRDGFAQGGQRDLTMAVLLVASAAALFLAIRQRSAWWMAGFGLLAGIALTIKPTTLPITVAQLAIAVYVLRKRSEVETPPQTMKPSEMGHPTFWAGLWMAVGPLAALAFLLQQHAVGAFWVCLRGIVPYYAGLGHKTVGYLLAHCLSPVQALVVLWVAVLALARPRMDWERGLLWCGVVFGLVSYVGQARGFPYHRYPLLAFLLPLMALDFSEAMPLAAMRIWRQRAAGVLALAGVCCGGLFLGPQSALMLHKYRWWQTDFTTTLAQNLQRLGGAELAGDVQCIDWISGCDTTLYQMRLEPATGLLLDFLIFGPDDVAVVRATRRTFGAEMLARPPRVIVVSSWLHINGPGEYKKLDRWPEFEGFLAQRYRLDTEWAPTRTEKWWSREELGPGYRIYVRR